MLTPDLNKKVLKLYRETRSPFKVANVLGLDVKDVFGVIDANPNSLHLYAERHGGEGRPGLRPFIVARKPAFDKWDNDDSGVRLARDRFCAGTHTMATHRDGGTDFLCSIPLRRRTRPNPTYFQPEPLL